MIVDAWAQHPTTRLVNHPMLDSLRRWTRDQSDSITASDRELPVSVTTDAMDRAGVSKSLISAWTGPQGDLISNDEVAAFVNEAPDRLVGVGSVNIARPMDAVREIRRCVKELGFKGVRVLPWLWELPPTHARFYPVFAECCELGVPFCTQVGHTGPLMPSDVGRPIPHIDQVAIDFPELMIVGGHVGYPWTEEMVAVATKHANVYIDTSAYTVKRYPPELVRFMAGHGRRKVLFGSNWPMITPERCLADIDTLPLDEEARNDFLGGNAARVFSL
ncbi:amidohydrolase [Tamilnaduibacter salinus]|uniref:Amidohydrolase n=1 Tax=Tamilnaduibacter salinus TaxID=1484056 RepID=A0A2A2I4Z0_9GAMM|nr:amidohydrolase family protein [Tamilnaduibacter salinus]PAV26190.1 amidohydrolase [Tamilnaduibacter salinus]